MIFRQLFEPDTSTYTYLLGCTETRKAMLIDPTLAMVARDTMLLRELGLELSLTLDTHIHADHVTGAKKLKEQTSCLIGAPALEKLDCVEVQVEEGKPVTMGSVELHPLFTPGHTDTHHCYLLDTGPIKMVFTGDVLLIDGCGRTDFQSGDSKKLYESIQEKLFSLPEETLVYPGHDYQKRRVSSIGQEKARNPRIGTGNSMNEFVEIMANLKLPYPRNIDFAVPANKLCGECPEDLPPKFRVACDQHDQG